MGSEGRALIVQANALRLPLPDECVDLAICSPPYYSLRRYDAEGIGNEPTPLEWLEALWAATAEVKRVLKPTGSIFVNLGDKYANDSIPGARSTIPQGGRPGQKPSATHRSAKQMPRVKAPHDGVREKSLLGLPGLYAAGCSGMLAAIGGPDPGLNLIWRRDQITEGTWIWHKLNGLPESVTDRTRSSHEYVFHFTREPRYYAALDTLREPQSDREHHERYGGRYGRRDAADPNGNGHTALGGVNPLGKLPGSVWPIASDPLRLPDYLVRDSNGSWMGDGAALWQHAARHGPGVIVEPMAHYAAYPPALVRRIILGWSPPGICVECGQGRWPVVDRQLQRSERPGMVTALTNGHGQDGREGGRHSSEATILGWACSCCPSTLHPGTGEPSGPYGRHANAIAAGVASESTGQHWGGKGGLGDRPKVGPWREYHLSDWTPPPTRPAVVLDPFSGVGTTCLVARALGRIGIGVDLSLAYSRAAKWRVFESGEWQDIIARTTGRKVRPLPKQHPGQVKLL
jgi:DNA methylase